MELAKIGTVSASIGSLVVKVLGAAVVIRRADRDDIAFQANNPESWSLTGTGIEQTKVEGEAGIFISGISIGSISAGVISGCQIGGYMIDANKDGVWINGKKQKDDPKGGKLGMLATVLASNVNEMTVGGIKVQVIDGTIYVNGKKQIDDVPEAEAGTEGETAAEPPKPKDPDSLEILVPHSFRGGLDVDFQGKRALVVSDDWVGGDFVLVAGDRTDVNLEGALREVGRFSFDYTGRGTAKLKDVACKGGAIKLNDRVTFDMGALTVVADGSDKPQSCKVKHNSSGAAKIGPISGPAAVVAELKDRGSLTLGDIETVSFRLDETGSGNATVGNIKTRAFVSNRGDRGVLQAGHVDTETANITHGGSGSASLDGITCLSNLVAKLTERGDLGLGVVRCDSFNLSQSDRGATTTADVKCNAFTGDLGDRGGLIMGDANVAGQFKLTQRGQGGTVAGKLTCADFVFKTTDRGDGVFQGVQSVTAKIDSTGRGSLSVLGGGAESGSVTSTDRGDVTLRGNFRSLRQSNSGRGRISIG